MRLGRLAMVGAFGARRAAVPRRLGCLTIVCALGLSTGCVSDRVLALEIRPPRAADGTPDVPADVVRWELRLARLEGDARCASAIDAADAREAGRLAHVQSFEDGVGMGAAIGEVPPGRWALAAIARTTECEVRLYGCRELALDDEVPETVVIDVAPVTIEARCGCRACNAGACDPLAELCE